MPPPVPGVPLAWLLVTEDVVSAKLDVALQEDTATTGLRWFGLAALVLVLDGIGVYCFWNHGDRKAMA